MKNNDLKSLAVFSILLLTGFLTALAGSYNGMLIGTLPIFGLSVGLAFLIQWLAFLPAYGFQTEKFFDLTGSLTYISLIILSLIFVPSVDPRSLLLGGLVILWAARLGSFLFRRILKAGRDDRFDDLKPSFLRFLNVWTIQALWVTFTMAAALAAITSANRKDLDGFAFAGVFLWMIGFIIEVIADQQKINFNANPENKGKFIQTGLWSRSRHPNYFGEITLWVGIAIIAIPVLEGWQWITMLSPVFVAFLLIRVSGIPLLEKKADAKWGGREEFEAYKRRTPVLIPRL